MNSFMIIAISWELHGVRFRQRRRLEDYGEELEDAMAQVLVGENPRKFRKTAWNDGNKNTAFPKKLPSYQPTPK